ncbi:hypothetical protein KUH03_10990 [Sphingobacterium sp. E70]|uniref:hypothetical protein n=1 Tax=Sphingobacterium sp. E70 TaxID=2853439 RepID=UPI00211CD458|nr:hypothetical protein [Sphingobacterium sp. E70]ULT27226.1 hypothetical protein KUH03_10990 [Sphingobacterium sp. E70]
MTPVDTLPGFQHHEPKLKVTGTVLKRDGKTPAQNVMVYIYHTNRQESTKLMVVKPVGRNDMAYTEAG